MNWRMERGKETQRRGHEREKARRRKGRKVIIYPVSSYCFIISNSLLIWTFQVGQWERICLPVQEMGVQSLDQEDPLEEEIATHSSILA